MKKTYKIGYIEYGFSITYRKWIFKITPKSHLLLACKGAAAATKVAKQLSASVKRNLKRQGLEKVDGLARHQISEIALA